jgi:DNA-binding beta-propeller fold protein YncE
MTPDGAFGFTPERDADTVSRVDLETMRIVHTVPFPAGSKPFMLRLTPDATRLWVQTSGTNENVILDAESLAVLGSTPVGLDPEQVAFQPGGPYALIAHLQSDALFVLDATTGAVVTTIECGATQANICYTPDGAFAFVASPSGDDVIVVDMARLAIVDRISTVAEPFGLVLLDPAIL